VSIYHLPVAIIGAGITGLSAAWELQQNYPGQSYIVLESSNRPGGKVISKKLTGPHTIIDGGPESFVTRKPEVWDLAHELNIENQIIVPASETAGMNVLVDGKIYSIPLHPIKFMRSELLSPRGKLRLLAEPFIKAKRDYDDETLADFVRRRLGDEMLQKLIGPVLGGIYNADPDKQSILYTSPVMREMEREHGGLFRGTLAKMRQKKKSPVEKKPSFIAFKNGAQTLVDALVAQLTGEIRLNSRVEHIRQASQGYQISLSNGDSLIAGGVILATPARAAAGMLERIAPDASAEFASLPQSSLGTIALLYRTKDLPDSDIKGLMIPRREKRMIDAIQFTSERMPGRTEDNYTLIRVFFGGAYPDMVTFDDQTRLHHVRTELQDLLNITAEPVHHEHFCWHESYPQANVGHLSKVDAIEALLPETIALAGASYRGLGVPDCVRQGRDAAQHIMNAIQALPELVAVPV